MAGAPPAVPRRGPAAAARGEDRRRRLRSLARRPGRRLPDPRLHRGAHEDAFYGSAAWREGPREAVLACIETDTDSVLTLDDATIDGLRRVGIDAGG
jgi:hypothetical protein